MPNNNLQPNVLVLLALPAVKLGCYEVISGY